MGALRLMCAFRPMSIRNTWNIIVFPADHEIAGKVPLLFGLDVGIQSRRDGHRFLHGDSLANVLFNSRSVFTYRTFVRKSIARGEKSAHANQSACEGQKAARKQRSGASKGLSYEGHASARADHFGR